MAWTPPSFTKIVYPDIPRNPPLWSRLSEPSEVLSPRLQASFFPQIKLNLQLSPCTFFFFKVSTQLNLKLIPISLGRAFTIHCSQETLMNSDHLIPSWFQKSTVFLSRHSHYLTYSESLSRVWLSAIVWTVAHQAPRSIVFSRQEYWSGLPCPSPGDLPDPGIEPVSPALQVNSLPTQAPRKPI